MKKLDPTSLMADWSVLPYHPYPWSSHKEPAPWGHVTSMELSKVLGKHLQTIANWTMRGVLPSPVTDNPRLRGNKNYFRISAIRAWLEQRSEFEIIKEWVQADVQTDELTDGQIYNLLRTVYKVEI